MTTLLRVEQVGKKYGDFQALKNVSFSVSKGETFAIIGPNGAGKTTLFKVMTGEVSGSEGRIFLGDQEITHASADQRVCMGMARTFQIVRVFPEFTLMENLIVSIEARNRSVNRRRRALRVRASDEVCDEAYQRLQAIGLAERHSTQARFLALGDRMRLELALTLSMEPSILMLDEPTAGMSPGERVAIIDLIERTREELGLTVLLTEHDMDFLFRLSTSLMVMNQGEKVFVGSPDEVKTNEMVQQIYLGKELVHA